MKINLFKVLLYDFLIVIIVNSLWYFLLVLVFNDSLDMMNHGGEFMIISIAELVGVAFFTIVYMASFFLPLFYIQRKQIEELNAPELFWRFMPFVTLLATFFAWIVMIIGGLGRSDITGEAWVNIWLIFGISYTGLIGFVYLVKPKNQNKEI
jgi:amino acid transporter